MLNLLSLILSFVIVFTTDYRYINGPATRVRGYTSQSIELANPFSREFFLDVPKEDDKHLLSFQGNHLFLNSKYSIYMGGKAKSLLESLRTSATDDYRQILVFDDYIMILREMNQVEIVEYNQTGFTKKSSFIIKEINSHSIFYKAYKYKNKALLFANNDAYLLSNQGYYDTLVFENPDSVSYAQYVPGTQNILLAQYGLGLGLYKVEQTSRRITKIKMFDDKFFSKMYISIQDINIDTSNLTKLFVLDRFSGVHQLKFNITDAESISYVNMVASQKGCYAMDTINFDYLVLSCQYQTQNYLTQIILDKNGSISMMKPLFKDEYILDVEVGPDYYLSLSRKVVNAYWNSKKNHVPQQYRFSNSLILPGLQVLSLVERQNKHDLFVISNNILTRYQLVESAPKIYFRSSIPTQKIISASIYGSCETLNKSLLEQPIQTKNQFCVYNVDYQINIVQPNKPQKSDVSASISIIIILFVVLGILIWICIKKYTKIQQQARRMLQEFQKRSPQNHITL